MRDKIYAADDRVTDALQDAYLWVLDRTGIYLSTLMMVVPAEASARLVIDKQAYFIAAIIFVVNAIALHPIYLRQHRGEFKIHNAVAMHLRTTMRWLRLGLIGFLYVPMLMVTVMSVDVVMFLETLGWGIFIYMHGIMLREREPKTFFETAPKFAESRVS